MKQLTQLLYKTIKINPPYIIYRGRTNETMHQDKDTYLNTYIDFFYKISDPKLKEKEKEYKERKEKELAYLSNCDSVYIALDKEYNYIGGYAINSVRPFRYFDVNYNYDNYEKIEEILKVNSIEYESDICEITMIWKNSKLSNYEMNWMYINSLYDAWKTNKRVIIGGAIHTSVAQRYRRVLSKILYFGIVYNEMFDKTEESDISKTEKDDLSTDDEKSGEKYKKFFESSTLGLVLFEYRKNIGWKLLLTLLGIVINSNLMLWLFGKKDVPMRLPNNIKEFASMFRK